MLVIFATSPPLDILYLSPLQPIIRTDVMHSTSFRSFISTPFYPHRRAQTWVCDDLSVYNTFENCSICLHLYLTVFVTFCQMRRKPLYSLILAILFKAELNFFRKRSSIENLATLDVEADTPNATFRRIHVITILIFWLGYFVFVSAYISIFSLCTVCIYTRVFVRSWIALKRRKNRFRIPKHMC